MRPLAQAMLGEGQVRHERLRPVANRFAYPTFFVLLPMRSLRERPDASLPRNRFGLVSFHDSDHGDGRGDSLAWIEEVLEANDVHDCDGEIWLHCYPRFFGFVFKPVSFWYAHRRDGSLAAVVVEVNNTFGERHCYLLADKSLAFGREQRATKVFHVSPFCSVAGEYRFRFMRTTRTAAQIDERLSDNSAERTVVRIDHHDAEGNVLLRTSVSGTLRPITAHRLRAAFFRMPLMTLLVVARIHWQALRLWFARVPFIRKPALPQAFVSRS